MPLHKYRVPRAELGLQRAGQVRAAPPDDHAGYPGGDLRGLPGQLHRAVEVTAGLGGGTERA